MGVALTATTATPLLDLYTNSTAANSVQPTLSERERIRMEFYKTYDVMTGIRIAATLGGFFALMVLLVLYKSKCKSRNDESLEAAITAVVAEEEELEAVLNFSRRDSIHGPRQSFGSMSAPAYTRFMSVGGYGGLMNPPIRKYDRGSKGRVSLPASDVSFRYFTTAPSPSSSQEQRSLYWKSYNEEDENVLEEVEEGDNELRHLQIPNITRRYSVESSTDTSLDRSTSFFGSRLGVEQASKSLGFPNIKVIQPTPQISPNSSSSGLDTDQKLAPLASFGSCSAISSISENPSVGTDSVFAADDDTDKDAEELSSKSDCTRKKYRIVEGSRFSDFAGVSPLPIVTNLTDRATMTSVVQNVFLRHDSESSSSSSGKGIISKIAIIETDSPKKTDFRVNKLSCSDPLSVNSLREIEKPSYISNFNLRTLSLRNLWSGQRSNETLF